MVKLIQKCGYVKAAKAAGYMKYIATREGVERIKRNGPVSDKQQEMIANILKDYPDGADFRDLERENGVTSLYDYDGFSHFIVADEDREKAYWQNGELECCLSGNVSKEELKEIINSIYKENEELEVFK